MCSLGLLLGRSRRAGLELFSGERGRGGHGCWCVRLVHVLRSWCMLLAYVLRSWRMYLVAGVCTW
jgi:hypothetical protein